MGLRSPDPRPRPSSAAGGRKPLQHSPQHPLSFPSPPLRAPPSLPRRCHAKPTTRCPSAEGTYRAPTRPVPQPRPAWHSRTHQGQLGDERAQAGDGGSEGWAVLWGPLLRPGPPHLPGAGRARSCLGSAALGTKRSAPQLADVKQLLKGTAAWRREARRERGRVGGALAPPFPADPAREGACLRAAEAEPGSGHRYYEGEQQDGTSPRPRLSALQHHLRSWPY